MSFWGWLTGETSTAKKVVDSVIDTGDALFYTDEEKARDYKSYRQWYLKYLEATQPQNIARRIIALIVTALWALLVLAGVIVDQFDNQRADYIFNTLTDIVNPPFMIIAGFYFLKHIAASRQ
jgi:hypothetical protein